MDASRLPLAFGTRAKSPFVSAIVTESDTTGTVAFGAEVFFASVRLVRPPPPPEAACQAGEPETSVST
ncbi:hypothetical protein D3C85_1814150 [compost metagenome]